MDSNLCRLDLDTLKTMYEQEASVLKTALLSGASWEELHEQRQMVTELAIALHQKKQSVGAHPAETRSRSDSRQPS
ncbi:MAG TPA: hypothetical protein VFR58_18610 [Flavisolibacter sp.]|nr:hypothetical protein [Flavisolibacter sp.]